MIERGHLRVLQIVSEGAAEALSRGEVEEARIRVEQAAAIKELEEARKCIFESHGVPDIEVELSSRFPTDNPLAKHLISQPFHEVLRVLMTLESLDSDEVAEKGGLSRTYVNQLARNDERIPSTEMLGKLIQGLGWDTDDWRTQLLVNKALSLRRNRTESES